jgi:hypothetical protein
LVTSWYDFVKKFGGYNTSYPATFGVGQFFQNGGSELYVRRVLGAKTFAASVNIPTTTTGNVATVTAKSDGTDGNLIRVELQATSRSGYYNFVVFKEATLVGDSVAANDVVVESFRDVLINDELSSDFIETVVNLGSQYVSITVTNGAGTPETGDRLPLTGGDNGDDPEAADYVAAVSSFSSIDRPLVIFAPEIMRVLDPADADGVHNALASWAQSNNGFAVLDTEEAVDSTGAPNVSIDDALSYATAITPDRKSVV